MKRFGALIIIFGFIAVGAGLHTLPDPRPRPQAHRFHIFGYTTKDEDRMVSTGSIIFGLVLIASGTSYIIRRHRDERIEAKFQTNTKDEK